LQSLILQPGIYQVQFYSGNVGTSCGTVQPTLNSVTQAVWNIGSFNLSPPTPCPFGIQQFGTIAEGLLLQVSSMNSVLQFLIGSQSSTSDILTFQSGYVLILTQLQ
jgi:hypothetical protein